MDIKIKSKGQIITFKMDKGDYPKIRNKVWWVKDNGYIYTQENKPKRKSIYLHRVIMNAPKGMVVDHINHNKLDNRKKNLRICTQSQNNMNKFVIVGVSKFRDRWRARIKVNGKEFHLGVFNNVRDALECRKSKELELFKEYSKFYEHTK